MPTILPIRHLHEPASCCNERPTDAFSLDTGPAPAASNDADLLASLIGGRSAEKVASAILNAAGSVSALARWTADDLRAFVPPGAAKRISAAVALGVRAIADQPVAPRLDTPNAILAQLKPLAVGLDVEKFWLLCLNRRLRLVRLVEITSGTATSTVVHVREVFREAIRAGACAVVVAHNHPSGDPTPSSADICVTRQLKKSGDLLDIDLVDHVIVGSTSADPRGQGYYSFRETGNI